MRRTFALVALALVVLSACSREDAVPSVGLVEGGAQVIEVAMPDMEATMVTIEGPSGTMVLERKAGEYVFQGDILLTEAQVDVLRGDGPRSAQVTGNATALRTLRKMWPSRTVYFAINSALPNQGRVTDAIAHWQANTDLRFQPSISQYQNYVEFVRGSPGSGCYSYLGMIGGRQIINLEDACSTGNAIHEIGHAVGLLHEHTRRDRDNTVIIHWNNIAPGAESQFQRYDQAGYDGFERGPFDLGSVMMYPAFAFTRNGLPTITLLNNSTFTAQRDGLSAGDRDIIAWMYGGPFARIEKTVLYEYNDWSNDYQEAEFSVSIWADRNYTIPLTLAQPVEIQYQHYEYEDWPYGPSYEYTHDVTVVIPAGSQQQLLESSMTTRQCQWDYGNQYGPCYTRDLFLYDGFGYSKGN